MVNNGVKVDRAGIIGLEILDELVHSKEKYLTEDGKYRHRKAHKYKGKSTMCEVWFSCYILCC